MSGIMLGYGWFDYVNGRVSDDELDPSGLSEYQLETGGTWRFSPRPYLLGSNRRCDGTMLRRRVAHENFHHRVVS